MAILIAGGAGYIGSHTALALLEQNSDVIYLDNLVKGHEKAVLGGKFCKGDLQDTAFLDRVFTENKIDAVIHFAAYSLVGESMQDPFKYYDNNLISTLRLVQAMARHNVKYIVFSSTAATYGQPENIPILETDRTLPTNPYGETKLAIEKMLQWADVAYGIKYTALRYFNVVGAHISGKIGEDHAPETHLIPIVMQAALGQRGYVEVYGDDYDTPDGTCIRDYIHVSDLADAHILALKKMMQTDQSAVYNLGNGMGFSVSDIINTVKTVTGIDIQAKVGPRRAGDPAILVASSEKAKRELGWEPKYFELSTIIETAWNWHRNNPNGFGD